MRVRFQSRRGIAHQIAKYGGELSRTWKTASCTSDKDKLGTNVAQKKLASVLQAASPELLKTSKRGVFATLCPLANSIRLYLISTSRTLAPEA